VGPPFTFLATFIALLLLPGLAPSGLAQLITTIAGTGSENVQATSAQLNEPFGVAVDGNGNFYIADRANHRIRKVSPSGQITTVAGTGDVGFSGDGGPASCAKLFSPFGVALDSNGNLYIADFGNHRIRKVSPSGTISTVAGTTTYGFSGDGGPATSARLSAPMDVAVDGSGNLYIADRDNHRIRKVNTSGIMSTVAGTGTYGYNGDGGPANAAQLNNPHNVAVDGSGNLYIGDSYNHRIRKVDADGVISTVAGIGTQGYNGDGIQATSAQLGFPYSIVLDGSNNLYIADSYNHRIRQVSPSGVITTVAGTGDPGYSGDGGPATSAQLYFPFGLAIDGSGNLYLGADANNRIRKVSPSGVITPVAGNGGKGSGGYSGDGEQAIAAQFNNPTGVTMDSNGSFYIADMANHCIRKVSSSGLITTIAGTGSSGYSGDGGPASAAQLSEPFGVTLDANGNLYIADRANHRIRKVNPSGIITTVAGTGSNGYSGDGSTATASQLRSPTGVAVDGSGNLYIADRDNQRIRMVNPSGIITTVSGTGEAGYNGDGGLATATQLKSPAGIAVDGNGNFYIADQGNHRIRKVSPSGLINTVAGKATFGIGGYSGDGGQATAADLYSPTGIVVDGGGIIYIADQNNHRIRKVNLSGVISTVTGTGEAGYCGNGGLASSGRLMYPYGLAVDATGNLYIADMGNHRIRKVNALPTVSISPASLSAVCSTSSFSLTAIAANFTPDSYSWSSQPSGFSASEAKPIFNAPTVSTATTYTVTVTASDVSNSLTASVILTVNPAPITTLSASGTLTCAIPSVTLTAGGGTTYQFAGPGIVSQSGNQAVINQGGIYSVTATGANSCSATKTTTVESNTSGPMITLKSGDWTDPTVWSCGRVPVSTDALQLNHVINIPGSYQGHALTISYGINGRVLINDHSSLMLGIP
jgi:sugar lactone lactonase YvrE